MSPSKKSKASVDFEKDRINRMKLSQVDKAIAELEGEQRVIQLAIDKLRATQAAKPARVRKTRKAAEEPKL